MAALAVSSTLAPLGRIQPSRCYRSCKVKHGTAGGSHAAGLSALALASRVACKATPAPAALRRQQRLADFERTKQQSLLDAAAVALLGALLLYANNGPESSEGWLLGAVFGLLYLILLQRDVATITVESNPFNLTNPFRILRFLLPFALVVALGLQHASSVGLEEWWQNVSWQPGRNFTGVVTSQSLLGALLSYAVVTAVLPLRGLLEALPEARTLVKAVPGSLGVALELAEQSKSREVEPQVEDVEVVPVLLITGPRGCGKSTLAQQLMAKDDRFQEPEWVATKPCTAMGSKQRIISGSDFQSLEQTRSLAVSYRPAGDDLEEVELGLPAMSVLATAQSGACVLDVDPPTARYILAYNFEPALDAAFEKKTELRIVTVWVSMRSLDDIMQRNRLKLESQGLTGELLEEQLKTLRSQVTSDMEWALTNGLDFTVLNEDPDVAAQEVVKASRYCFEDPF